MKSNVSARKTIFKSLLALVCLVMVLGMVQAQECNECDGKVSELTMRYDGDSAAVIKVEQKDGDIVFEELVPAGDEFSFVGTEKDTLGKEITLYVDGVENVKIHTSCSKPVGPGLVTGDFTVIAGESKDGGTLCPVNGDDDEDCECDGKVTELTLRYNGSSAAVITVEQKKDHDIVFGELVYPGGIFSFVGTDNGTLGTEIIIYVDGVENIRIHTSCSDPIGPGLVFGDFTIIYGESKDNGPLCCLDPSGCPDCGNNVIEGSEACDGSDLDGKTCLDFGFTGGILTCTGSCTFDNSGCTLEYCGNDLIEAEETCDGSDLDGKTCLDFGFTGGVLGCDPECDAFDTSRCTSEFCGNNLIESPETCDGTNLDGKTCLDFGFIGGILACTAGCAFDTSGCYHNYCGNDMIELPEICDGIDLDNKTCLDFGFLKGILGCDLDCGGFDTSKCEGQICGNNSIEVPETCDGSDLDGKTCLDFGFTGGVLGCDPECDAFDTSRCTIDYCGNNFIDEIVNEPCDGTDLDNKTCFDFGFTQGILDCKIDCSAFDTSGCYTPPPCVGEGCAICGNGSCDPGENCANCAIDCPIRPGQVCCGGGVFDGDCCKDEDCARSEVCEDYHCFRPLLRVFLDEPSDGAHVPRGPLDLVAEVYFENELVSGAEVTVESTLFGEVRLYDDGRHNDGPAGDGVYGNDTLVGPEELGPYPLFVSAEYEGRFDKRPYSIIVDPTIFLNYDLNDEYFIGQTISFADVFNEEHISDGTIFFADELNQEYFVGETIYLGSLATNIIGQRVTFPMNVELLAPGDWRVFSEIDVINGEFAFQYPLAYGVPTGVWEIILSGHDKYNNIAYDSRTFLVKGVEEEINVISELSRESLEMGESVRVTAQVFLDDQLQSQAQVFAIAPNGDRIQLVETTPGVYSGSYIVDNTMITGLLSIPVYAQLTEEGVTKSGGDFTKMVVKEPHLTLTLVGLQDSYALDETNMFTIKLDYSVSGEPSKVAEVLIDGIKAVQTSPGIYAAPLEFEKAGVKDIKIQVTDLYAGVKEKTVSVEIVELTALERVVRDLPTAAPVLLAVIAVLGLGYYYFFFRVAKAAQDTKNVNALVKQLQNDYFKKKSISKTHYDKRMKELSAEKAKLDLITKQGKK